MRKRIVIALCTMAACTFAVLCFVMPAQAKEVTVEAPKFGSSTSNLSASITYDDTIVEGTPTVFTINASGCSRQPEFLFNSLMRKNGNSYEKVIDLSYKGFSTNNSLQEQLHFSGTYKLRFYIYVFGDWREDKTRLPLESQAFEVEFTMTAETQIEPANKIIDRVVTDCNAQGFTSQYEKALWLNDWIVDNTNYDNELTHSGADNLFIDGIGTCEAYHEAYTILLNRVGIETRRVDWGGSVNHVWTGAKLDGKWYNIDTTWNKAKPYYCIDTKHLYFGMPTEAMRYLRPEWDGTYNAGRTEFNETIRYSFDATDYEGHYFIKTGAIKTWSDIYAQSTSGAYSVKAHIDKKETSFSLPVENDYWAPDYINSVYPLVAYQLSKTDWGSAVSKLDCKLQGEELVFTVTYKSSTSSSSSSTTPSSSSSSSASSSTKPSNPGTSTKPSTPAKISGTWIKSGARWWYKFDGATQKATGKQYPYNEFVDINGVRYHFDSAGWMHTGWQKLSGIWYYFNGSGAMTKGWQYVGGAWYHLGTEGKMLTGWKQDGSAKYYLSGSGAMVTGWQKISGTWYFFNGSGAMTKGWQYVGGAWYHMASNGMMQTGWFDDRGTWYHLSGSGAMQTGWQKIDGIWYYFNGSGAMLKNRWVGNYWLGSDGKMATGAWVDNNKYYVDGNGAWIPNKKR